MFSSPFIEERLYLHKLQRYRLMQIVLVPFYRGAVVFTRHATPREIEEYEFSSPFIEERLYLEKVRDYDYNNTGFSSPFIEERLYLKALKRYYQKGNMVLVPFYRGAVVFRVNSQKARELWEGSRPLLSRSGCISTWSNPLSSDRDVLVPFYRGAVVFKLHFSA